MHILVLQHAREEHPGIFRKFLLEDGHTWDSVELDEGEKLPLIDNYDALWVMGGPMDVWEEEKYPWLCDEKSFIKKAVEEKFNVKVSKVAISNRKGKAKQMTVKSNGRTIRTDGFAKSKKRAIVTLIDGYNIDLFSI